MSEESTLSADNPLTDPDKDALGYAPFAKHLARSLRLMVPTDGIVVAIHGPWGSGKSTILNFVLHYLNEDTDTPSPILFPFNPWWFSGQEDLTRHFFGQLQVHLKGKNLEPIKEKLANLAELVSKVPFIPGIEATEVFANLLRKQQDLSELKREISNMLRKQDRKILVLVDDVDRLLSDEIRQLFRTIKAVANFPNVIDLIRNKIRMG